MKTALVAAAALLLPSVCIGASPKRGICWEEGVVNLNGHHAALMSPGVSWAYTWGPSPANQEVYSDNFCFIPMAWNGSYDAEKIRTWLSRHPETRYLLGFNEPNFANQARMTPAQAAEAWPGLEAIAEEYGVKLVAPALNFADSQVGGKVWGIYEWYDEFFRLYPEARVDCLALHCYMNWYSAARWFVTEYFYKDLFDPKNENYGKYPHLVKFLEDFKAANGDFPHMMLTEFCGWEYDYLPDVYFQIDQMTQKVQMLEQSDLVEGYAWFMGNAAEGASAFPYMSIFEENSSDSPLSELGLVYVNMSAFDTSLYYAPGEIIEAKDYIDATTDNEQVKLRRNSETSSDLPLQIEMPARGRCEYLIDVPEDAEYLFQLHAKTDGAATLSISVDSRNIGEVTMTDGKGDWTDSSAVYELPAGVHTLTIANFGQLPIILNRFSYSSATGGVEDTFMENNGGADGEEIVEVYNMQGISMGNPALESLPRGIYIIRKSNGRLLKTLNLP